MLSLIPGAARLGLMFGLKPLRYFIDSRFRAKVTPQPGSVVYCDLWVAAEHSGIYLGNGDIANIEVTGFAERMVTRCDAGAFTSKATLGRGIYVSCDRDGAVGSAAVAAKAAAHVGERGFYGLLFANCHVFSTKCVNHHPASRRSSPDLPADLPGGEWELTLRRLKEAARHKLGATKWRLWDWQAGEDELPEEPDWQAHTDHFRRLPLDAAGIGQIRAELADTLAYEAEIADEDVPRQVRDQLARVRTTLGTIADTYDKASGLLALCPDAAFSFEQLQACPDDFSALARTLKENAAIRELVRKLGRDYVSEENNKQQRVPHASNSEVHGTHRSGDVMRMLPSELLNLEDDTLEALFYARLLETGLLTYQLQGTQPPPGQDSQDRSRRTGPVVACLDTSGSMEGAPLLKARALLLAIANMLGSEGRSLHVLLFGAQDELREFSMTQAREMPALLAFLRQGFGGGTSFETPLQRAFAIIGSQAQYKKADILMISDGACSVSPEFAAQMRTQKETLGCMVHSVLCAHSTAADNFSDAVLTL